ncbi:MAG: hypothetical protein FJX73_04860 [Armatimonadetes bacterium]|nr:hypothetical protein [Armatimonadota bacterium]
MITVTTTRLAERTVSHRRESCRHRPLGRGCNRLVVCSARAGFRVSVEDEVSAELGIGLGLGKLILREGAQAHQDNREPD